MRVALSILLVLGAGLARSDQLTIRVEAQIFKVQNLEWFDEISSNDWAQLFSGTNWQAGAVCISELDSQLLIGKEYSFLFDAYTKYYPNRYDIRPDATSYEDKAYPKSISDGVPGGAYLGGSFGTSTNLNCVYASTKLRINRHGDWIFDLVRVGDTGKVREEYMDEEARALLKNLDETKGIPYHSDVTISEDLKLGVPYVWRTVAGKTPDVYFLKLLVEQVNGNLEPSETPLDEIFQAE